MKTTVTIICLAILLGLPFAVREGLFAKRAELYPAVLFPVGDGKIDLRDRTIRSSKMELFSLDDAGVPHELTPADFFDPIPTVYWPHVASEKKKFGLAAPGEDRLQKKLGSWQLTLMKNRSSTPLEKREVAQWLAQRLRAVGRPLDRTLVIRKTSMNIDTATGEELNSEITFEYEIRLDDY